jgi:SAM-dependent methyltransferase
MQLKRMAIAFDPQNPFPLVPVGASDYQDAKNHSILVDQWLGFDISSVEAAIGPVEGQENWSGRDPQIFLTPYVEIRSILEDVSLRAAQSVIDLGAGYGRMAFVMARHFPLCDFLGIELEAARVAEGQRCLAAFRSICPPSRANLQLSCADLVKADFEMPIGDVYFIYDFGTRRAIENCLQRLRLIAQKKKTTVVARGRGARDSIERANPWLSQVVNPLHRDHYSIYFSA